MAALELIVEQLVATSMNAHPAAWEAFEGAFGDAGAAPCGEASCAMLADALSAAAANDVLSILRAARRRSDQLAAGSAER